MKMMKRSTHRSAAAVLASCILASFAIAQKPSVIYGPEHTVTNAPPGSYTTSNSMQDKDAPDFRYRNQQYIVPVATPIPWTEADEIRAAQERVMGKVKRYSDVQYGDMITDLLNTENQEEGKAPVDVQAAPKRVAVVRPTVTPEVQPAATPTPAATLQDPELRVGTVASILNRGVLVTSSGLHLRLRGVSFPSASSSDPFRQKLAASGAVGLKKLVLGRRIYYVIEEPQKGLDGSYLAIVHLRDGTELNRLVLESGMALFAPGDFPEESAADGLASAEADARKAKRGFWAN
jgi:endonuclease YncB( thermonuclease family)